MASPTKAPQALDESANCLMCEAKASGVSVELTRRNKQKGPIKTSKVRVPQNLSHLSGLQLLLKSVNWSACTVLILGPIITALTIFYIPLTWKTAAWSAAVLVMSLISITAGYHRCFSHRSYTSAWPLKIFWLTFGSAAVQGSARWWCKLHRAHHRFTDTERDPYNAVRGLFYSHVGWAMLRQDYERVGHVNMDDLNDDPFVMFQWRYFPFIGLFMGYVFPPIFAWYFWDDFTGCLCWSFVRVLVAQHLTLSINSLAHWMGDAPYDSVLTARDSHTLALFTFGEGYHNYHHEFPNDYRLGIHWYDFDVTKQLIYILSFVGLTYDLKRAPNNEIQKAKLMMGQRRLDSQKAQLKWGRPVEQLSQWTIETFNKEVQLCPDKIIFIVQSVIYDVSEFLSQHPGGEYYFKKFSGKDVTEQFNGGVYNHTNAARNFLSRFRIAKLS